MKQAVHLLEAETSASNGPGAPLQRWGPVQPVARIQSPFVSPFSAAPPTTPAAPERTSSLGA